MALAPGTGREAGTRTGSLILDLLYRFSYRWVKHRSTVLALSLALGVVAWQLVGSLKISTIIPTVDDTVVAFYDLIVSGTLLGHLANSLANYMLGLVIALVGGVFIGALMGLSRTAQYMLEPFVNAGNAAPRLAFIPLFVILFGIGPGSRIAAVVISSFFAIALNTFVGFRTVDQPLIEMGRVFGASRWMMARKIYIPAALPLILNGIRLGMGRGVDGMVSGEMLITIVGLGAMVKTYAGSYNGAYLFSVFTAIVLVALAVDSVARTLEARWTSWK